jgi:predicted DNA binding protein
MSLVIEYRESSPHIKITDVAGAVPELSLRVLRWRRSDEDRLRLFLLAEGNGFERLESELAAQSNVVEVTTITDEGDARLYRVTLVSTVDHLPGDARVDGVISDVRVEPDGIYVTGYISDRTALFEISEFLAEREIDMQVERLYEATDERQEGILTDEQLEALVVAYEMGYFTVPREATQSDVAAELGISPASLSERLKRGQERLIERHLDERHVVTTHD